MDNIAKFPPDTSDDSGRDPDPALAGCFKSLDTPGRRRRAANSPYWDGYAICLELAQHCQRLGLKRAAVARLLGGLGAAVPGWPCSADIAAILHPEDGS